MSLLASIITAIALIIAIIFLAIPSTPQSTTSTSLEQMQAKCIDRAVIKNKFEQIENCLKITGNQEVSK